jgi:F-type H+-transporting ATPase subunit gamma
MTQRRQLEQRLAGQTEIAEILTSMKNLAYLETRKLARRLENQRLVVQQIERVAQDFLAFHPGLMPPVETDRRAYLVVGSRRGLCGDFNSRLVSALRHELADQHDNDYQIIAVGHKLCQRLADESLHLIELEGGDVAEEIPQVIQAIVRELDRQPSLHSIRSLIALYHSPQGQAPLCRQLLPPFHADADNPAPTGFAPLLNLPPQEFLLGLIDQYLYACLHTLLYQSLEAENLRRIRHLDGAVHHLEESAEGLQQRIRMLRQEEIIEEIEVILLNAVR